VGFIDELVHMQTAGMPSLSILNSATGVSADTLDFPDRIGQLAPGFRSRMILTRHDPLASVANLHKAKSILFDGTAVQCPERLDPSGLYPARARGGHVAGDQTSLRPAGRVGWNAGPRRPAVAARAVEGQGENR